MRRDLEKAREFERRGRGSLTADPEKTAGWQERSRQRARDRAAEQPTVNTLEHSARRGGKGISPASKAQRDAADLATCCTACGRERSAYVALDPAHLCARSHGGCDDPLCTPFHLCRTSDGSGCHREFDEHRLDLLKVVNAEPDRYRQALQHALEHLNVVELVERLAGARTQWSVVS